MGTLQVDDYAFILRSLGLMDGTGITKIQHIKITVFIFNKCNPAAIARAPCVLPVPAGPRIRKFRICIDLSSVILPTSLISPAIFSFFIMVCRKSSEVAYCDDLGMIKYIAIPKTTGRMITIDSRTFFFTSITTKSDLYNHSTGKRHSLQRLRHLLYHIFTGMKPMMQTVFS